MRLGGVSEVAKELGISPQRIRVLRTSDQSTFPEPLDELSAGPVWDLDQIEAWNLGRRGPGRPPLNLVGGRYELEDEPIGSGGFADVYRALDATSGEVVAVKALRQVEDLDHMERFRRELRLLEPLRHPNVVPVLASGTDQVGRPWYAMPLAVGSLDDLLDQIEDDDQIIEVMLQVCDGLRYLHTSNVADSGPIFHRDLCPSNVLRTSEATWAIADFGLAREAERRSVAYTKSSVIAGHVHYLSPEQLAGLKHAEVPADLFGLGRTLQALVLHRCPVMMETYDGDSAFGPVIRKLTSPRPEDRYRSVDEVVEVLKLIQTAPDVWVPPADRMERLCVKLEDAEPNSEKVVEDFRDAMIDCAGDPAPSNRAVHACTHLTGHDVEYLVESNLPRLRKMIHVWSDCVRRTKYGFDFCDRIAQFGEDVLTFSDRDPEVLECVVAALVELGYRHNRWYVRDTVIHILQGVRERAEALTALQGLRECDLDAVRWNLTEFALQSLHPMIRQDLLTSGRR